MISIKKEKNNNFDPYFTPHTKVHLGWSTDWNMIGKKAKLLEQNIGKYLHDFGVGKNDLNRTQILKSYKNH